MGRTISKNGFTLVELLVVLAILGLIMGLVGPKVTDRFSRAKGDIAKLQIQEFGAALDLFFLDTGRYPTTEEGLRALVSPVSGLADWSGPYLRDRQVPSDPWGSPYRYASPGDLGPYDLISYGADNSPGGDRDASDISSWN